MINSEKVHILETENGWSRKRRVIREQAFDQHRLGKADHKKPSCGIRSRITQIARARLELQISAYLKVRLERPKHSNVWQEQSQNGQQGSMPPFRPFLRIWTAWSASTNHERPLSLSFDPDAIVYFHSRNVDLKGRPRAWRWMWLTDV